MQGDWGSELQSLCEENCLRGRGRTIGVLQAVGRQLCTGSAFFLILLTGIGGIPAGEENERGPGSHSSKDLSMKFVFVYFSGDRN